MALQALHQTSILSQILLDFLAGAVRLAVAVDFGIDFGVEASLRPDRGLWPDLKL